MDGCPLGLGLVVEDKPTEFSCTHSRPLYTIKGTYCCGTVKVSLSTSRNTVCTPVNVQYCIN